MIKKIIDWYFRWNGVPLTLTKTKRTFKIILDILFVICIISMFLVGDFTSALFYGFVAVIIASTQYWLIANNLSKQIKQLKSKDNGV
jgi:hypothetical protein